MTTPRQLIAYLDGLPEPHIVFDPDYRIVAANAAYQRDYGQGQAVVGRRCYQVSHHIDVPCDQAGESCPLARSRQSGQVERVLHLHHTAHGEEYVHIELTPVLGEDGQVAFYVEKMAAMPLASSTPAAQGLIGRSGAFQHMLDLLARVAPSSASVLLLGESGTGKELLARAIHEASPRARKPLVVVDCASLTESLFESELFGHERGAFTGANQAKAGLVEAAHGGTLFLDEVGDIPLAMQVKLLRLLESGTHRRVGSTELRHTDLRIVAATHRDLAAMVAQGGFREDLYYRLSVFPIAVPPLRERHGDMALLAPALLERVAPQRRLRLSAPAMALLERQHFRGNVRELRNLLERSALLCDGQTLEADHLALALSTGGGERERLPSPSRPATPVHSLQAASDEQLRRLLAAHPGSRAELAAQLGMSERTLYRKLKALG
ncbi:MAG: Transcriptional regulatory protein ZraR [Pseudomonadota bacterium]|jgi:transcriptional regulator with PAS, ATPase and Fis domain